MEVQKINSEIAQNPKITKKDAAVHQLQTEFLLQVAEGKEGKEAFYDSIKAVKDKNEMKTDCFCYEATIGASAGAVKTAVTPEEISKWLDIIAKVGPMALAFITWLDNFISSHKPQKEQHAEEINAMA